MMTSATPSAPDPSAPREGTILGHPPGLLVLFFTEMWERFSYYGMRALLVLYMVNYFKWSQERASGVYKWYTSLVYLTPILGGYVADRYLGNRRAVVIGAILMSIGHFLMAFEAIPIFYAALVFLIAGNGMFKPNMSTQVGRLYAENDGRRDAAYTIFYMGINLGAFLSPLVCGELRKRLGFHYGFGAAGVGMLVGLCVYLFGLKHIKEVSGKRQEAAGDGPEAEDAPSALSGGGEVAKKVVLAIAALAAPTALGFKLAGHMAMDNLVGAEIGAMVGLVCAWILFQVKGAARDRVFAIYAVALFVVFFWAAFEQAGNAMNLWADQTTERYLTQAPPAPSALPAVAPPIGFGDAPAAAEPDKVGGLSVFFNPVSTESFQSINALAVFTLAPLFAMLWTWLDRRKLNPSIPTKMAFGVLLMGSAFGLMTLAARAEDRPSRAALAQLPPQVRPEGPDGHLVYRDPPDFTQGELAKSFEPQGAWVPAQAERLFFKDGQLEMRGVLADVERDRILRATAPASFVKAAQELALRSSEAQGDAFKVSVTLDEVPPGFDLRFAGYHEKNLHFDPATKTLTLENVRLADKDYKAVLLAGADPGLRTALGQLYVTSQGLKVSAWWLVLFYVISTLGELCLSPVGLSMVSKLAPAKFATMLMGVWLLTSFFGNFLAGAAGESWGSMTPTSYFIWLTAVLGGAAAVLFLLVRKIGIMMHGVK